MAREEDFSIEDDKEVVETFSQMAQNEFNQVVNRIRYEQRKERVLVLRALGRVKRKELRAKYSK